MNSLYWVCNLEEEYSIVWKILSELPIKIPTICLSQTMILLPFSTCLCGLWMTPRFIVCFGKQNPFGTIVLAWGNLEISKCLVLLFSHQFWKNFEDSALLASLLSYWHFLASRALWAFKFSRIFGHYQHLKLF